MGSDATVGDENGSKIIKKTTIIITSCQQASRRITKEMVLFSNKSSEVAWEVRWQHLHAANYIWAGYKKESTQSMLKNHFGVSYDGLWEIVAGEYGWELSSLRKNSVHFLIVDNWEVFHPLINGMLYVLHWGKYVKGRERMAGIASPAWTRTGPP